MNPTERALLNVLQRDFPLIPRPWAAVGEHLGLSEEATLRAVQTLRADGLLRQIGPIFDSHRLGYKSSLVAVCVADAQLETVAAAVSRHPGVSHNYQREHAFNLWFTIAVPPEQDLEAEVRRLTDQPGVEAARLLPVLKLYKIGVNLDLEREETELAREEPAPERRAAAATARPLTERDRTLIRATQADLPLDPEPFAAWARNAGVATDELLAWLREMKDLGYLRRFGAVLRHREAGFAANGMIAWRVPEARVDEAGRLCASFPQVSHCYRRPVYPDWPYSLFSMVHARTRENCEEIARRMAKELAPLGVAEHAILYSVKEFKKERVKYFV